MCEYEDEVAILENKVEELQSRLDEILDAEVPEPPIVEIRCSRCDRPFRSLASVKFCTQGCELGYGVGE